MHGSACLAEGPPLPPGAGFRSGPFHSLETGHLSSLHLLRAERGQDLWLGRARHSSRLARDRPRQ